VCQLPAKGGRLPQADHVLRYIRRKHVDKDTNTLNGSGFLARPDEGTPSTNWLECFSAPLEHQVLEIKARKRIKYERRGKLVRLNVGATEQYIFENAAAAEIAAEVHFIHDPLEAEATFPADPSHALATGVPVIDTGPEAELIGDLFLDCVLGVFDVEPD
jgi:hypothetical protein